MKKKVPEFLFQSILFLFINQSNTNAQNIVFIKEPQGEIVIIGSTNISFPCEATTSKGLLSIVWKHNNTWVTDYKNKHFNQVRGSLVFTKFLERDVGKYQCSVIRSIQNKHVEQISSRIADIRAAFIGSTFKSMDTVAKGKINSTIHLQCVTPDSLPSAEVSWYKDGKKLSNYRNGSQPLGLAVSSTLELKNFMLSDEGNYRCVAFNPLLRITVKGPIIVVSVKADRNAPYFLLQPSPITVIKYHNARFDCLVLGDPKPVLTWQKGNVLISNSSKYNILLNGSLLIMKLQESDIGLYTCSGSNFISSIHSVPVKLTLAYINFDFIENPKDLITFSTTAFILNCTPPTSHPPRPHVQWYYNYQLVVPSQRMSILPNNSLLVRNSSLSDEGSYFCQATNTFTKVSRTSKSARVIVYVAPKIATMASLSVIQGGSIMISCTASGIPQPNVTIERVIDPTTTTYSKSPLRITSAVVSDDGIYTCVAQNDAGTSWRNITLTVFVPSYVVINPKNQSIVYGQISSVQFICRIQGNPAPKISWYFGDFLIENSLVKISYNTTTNGEVLTLYNLSKKFQGFYKCLAENHIGKTSVKAYLKIEEPPVIVSSSNSPIRVLEGTNTTLTCTVKGDPEPQVFLYYKERKINVGTNDRFSKEDVSQYINKTWFVTTYLHIRNIEHKLHGAYQCVGVNLHGNQNRTMEVEVQVKPRIVSFVLSNNYSKAGDNITVSCVAFGYPNVKMRLLHNGTIILQNTSSNGYTVQIFTEITNTTLENSGSYACAVSNQFGMDERNLSLIVMVQPSRPVVQITSISSRSFLTKWSVTFNGNSPIRSFVLEVIEDLTQQLVHSNHKIRANQASYFIDGLKPFALYSVRMKAMNDVGDSEYSRVVNARTEPEEPSLVPGFRVTNQTSRCVSLAWFPPAVPNGPISIFQVVDTVNRLVKNVTITIQQSFYEYVIHQLSPYTTYKLKIRAGTHHKGMILWSNFSEFIEATTLDELPGDTVHWIRVSLVTSSSFRADYPHPDPEKLYGPFEDYQIQLKIHPSGKIQNFSTTKTWFQFTGLSPYMLYELSIAIRNRKGIGKYSRGVQIRTNTSVPGKVVNVTVTEVNTTTIKIEWKKPLVSNGPITGYKVMISNQNERTILLEPVLFLFSRNFTGNTTYIVRVAARTSAGFGQHSDGVRLRTSENFKGLSGETTPAPTAVAGSWLDREYMIVIVGVSAFACFLLLSLLAIGVIRCHFAVKSPNKYSTKWEVNPYYDNADGGHVAMDRFNKRRKSYPTVNSTTPIHDPHLDDDLIWDDEAVDDLIDSSSIEPEYATARTPLPPPPPPPPLPPLPQPPPPGLFPPPPSDIDDNMRSSDYSSVDPYQGRRAGLSPLVKLKGMRKNKRHPKIPAFSPTPIHKNMRAQENTTNSHTNFAYRNEYVTPQSPSQSSASSSTNIRQSSQTDRRSSSSRSSSLSGIDINHMYRDASRQQKRKQRRTADGDADSNYTDVIRLSGGRMQQRDTGLQF